MTRRVVWVKLGWSENSGGVSSRRCDSGGKVNGWSCCWWCNSFESALISRLDTDVAVPSRIMTEGDVVVVNNERSNARLSIAKVETKPAWQVALSTAFPHWHGIATGHWHGNNEHLVKEAMAGW